MRPLVWFVASALVLVASRAHATAEFPAKIVTDLNVTCPNPIWDNNGCTICHTSNNGGLGTATMPFGAYMKSHGLTAFNDGKLQTILAQLQAESPHTTDTNCDGKPDIDQLTTCDWQGLATKGAACGGGDGGTGVPVSVYYGCSATPSDPALPASMAIGIAGVLVVTVIRASSRKRSADRDRRSSPR
jgi:hypothetical protein